MALLWQSGRALASASLMCRTIAAVLPLAALWVGKLIIDVVVKSAKTSAPVPREIWLLLAAEFVIAIVGAVLSRIVTYCDGRLADRFSREVTLRVMNHAAALDLGSFEDPVFYDRLERARVQANDRLGMLNALGQLVQQTVTLFSLAVGIFLFSPLLFALMAVAVIPAFLGESHFAFLEYALAYSLTPLRRELDYLRDLATKKEAAKELKIFGHGSYLRERYASINDEVIDRSQKLAARRLRAGILFTIVGSLGYYAAYASLVLRTLRGELTVGELTFLAGALAGASSQIQLVLSTFTGIADQALFFTDLFEFFAMQPKIRTQPWALPGPRPIQCGIEFRDVSFVYPDSTRRVLDHLDFRIDAGERVAVVGGNGEGKTTLVKLMTRLYEPSNGRILLDGVDLREYDLEDLHRQIGVIFQDFMRYDLTLRENLAIGRLQDRGNDAILLDAAMQSGAREVLGRLRHGLDQMLGRRFEDGTDLSGGEWQKIALARMYLRDAQLLILDEPTAALDAAAEYDVFQRFAELTHNRTALFISHRFSTVRMSDRIVVLERGVIHENGTHEQLMARAGKYSNMFELQAASYR
jgi:ATP-binding cassette, subfamily B, bacterial